MEGWTCPNQLRSPPAIAARYATAIFELSKEAKALKALEKDVDALKDALAVSAELRNLISSPVYSREDVAAAIGAIAAKMGAVAAGCRRSWADGNKKRRMFVRCRRFCPHYAP